LELKNIETHPYKEEEKLEILRDVCNYVGKYLQVYLKRYLGKRDPQGFRRTKRTFWGFVQKIKENHVFLESFRDCSRDNKISDIEIKIYHYIEKAYSINSGLYGILTLYLGILIAYKLGFKIPTEKKLLLAIFLPAAYAMVNMLEIKEGVFQLEKYNLIPIRGQVLTFINEFLNNEAFHEHFIFSLKLLK